MTVPGGRCDGEVCVTCSDEALPWTVVAVDDDLAWVDTGDGREQVSIALVEAGVGDVVLVHAGEAIACLGDAAQRSSTIQLGDAAQRSSTIQLGDAAQRSSTTSGSDPA